MKTMTKKGGLIGCHEIHRHYESFGLFFRDEKDLSFEKGVIQEKFICFM
jgi:hypothetical protein